MTTENLPADWAITKALELMRSRSALAFVKRNPDMHPNTIRVARYIEQHEQPPVDPLVEALQVWGEAEYGSVEADALRAALAARGLKIVEDK